jgi:hypothetical protein
MKEIHAAITPMNSHSSHRRAVNAERETKRKRSPIDFV